MKPTIEAFFNTKGVFLFLWKILETKEVNCLKHLIYGLLFFLSTTIKKYYYFLIVVF